LHDQASYTSTGDDTWQPWIVNQIYGTSVPGGSGIGNNMGYTAWTHGSFL
jgi:hypothetical protein